MVRDITLEISVMLVLYSTSPKPIKLSFETEWNQSQVTLMLTWDWCKMLTTNIPMISKSWVPYPRFTYLESTFLIAEI